MEFKPGSYSKGDIVTVNGIQYVADRDISNALALPKDNMYWTSVGVAEPIPTTPIVSTTIPGLSTQNSAEQNSLAVDKFINALPEGFAGSVYIPAGNYPLAREIKLYRKPIHLYGDNGTIFGNSTKLIFPYNSNGIVIDRGGASLQETIIERICLVGTGGDGSNGNGIRSNARMKLRDVTMKSFSQNGLLIWANLDEGGDASGSIIQSCHALENNHDGFLAGRVDANCITFINCDGRDNGRYNFNEDSFLGNTYIGCMSHYGKQGDFFVRDKGNARSTFIGCYTEGGSKPSQLSPKSVVVGGLWGSGYSLDGTKIIYT